MTSVEDSWRRVCEITYNEQTIARISADDPHRRRTIPPGQRDERDLLIAQLASKTGMSGATLRSEAHHAAWQHLNDPGTDFDPDRFAPPNFTQLRMNDLRDEELHRSFYSAGTWKDTGLAVEQ